MTEHEAIRRAREIYHSKDVDIWIMHHRRLPEGEQGGWFVLDSRIQVSLAIPFAYIHQYWSPRLKYIERNDDISAGNA